MRVRCSKTFCLLTIFILAANCTELFLSLTERYLTKNLKSGNAVRIVPLQFSKTPLLRNLAHGLCLTSLGVRTMGLQRAAVNVLSRLAKHTERTHQYGTGGRKQEPAQTKGRKQFLQ